MQSLWRGFLGRLGTAILACLLVVPALAQDTVDNTPQPTDPEVRTLTIWLPTDLFSPNNMATLDVLTSQLDVFMANNPMIDITWRFKRVGEIGGVLSTLRTANSVAPGALPDLTLMRRQDLATAQRTGLIQSQEGLLPSALLANLQQRLKLGQVDNTLYGLPYVLNVLHMAYHGRSDRDYNDWSYDAVLERGQELLLPLGRVLGLPPIVYVQYLHEGGLLSAEDSLTYNAEVIETTLRFYERLIDNNLISIESLDYLTPNDYIDTFTNSDDRALLLTSSQYLALKADDVDLQAGMLPSSSGDPITMLDGWMWVFTSSAPDQQQAAAVLIDWLMRVENQVEIANSLSMLPSLNQALDQVVADDADRDFYTALITNAYLPVTEGEGDVFSRAFETALVSIIRGEQTTLQALDNISIAIEAN